MPKLHVHTPFTLRADDGSTADYNVGLRHFSEDDASHWYVKLHAGEPPESPAQDLPEGDASALAELEAELKAKAERLNERSVELDRRELELDERAAELDKLAQAINAIPPGADKVPDESAKQPAAEQKQGAPKK